MPNKLKYLLLTLIFVSLFLPRPAAAIFGTGIFDLFDNMLAGIEETTGTFAALIIVTVFFYLILLLLFWASGFILEVLVVNQAAWMAGLQGMTEVGWNFTAGIANTLLIIIFLVIAFAFIFKIETLQAKKSLPKLIIIAILLNFSLLFVNGLVDISQIGYNTILEAMPDGVISGVIGVLVAPLLFSVAAAIALIAGLVIAWSIPIANAFAQILFAAIFVPVILPALALVAVQMFLFAPLALMFLLFVFLFGARVFILQILAMIAPLAFICLILPQTKKYWDEWFKTLTEWLLLGVVVLFFLALGFSALNSFNLEPGAIIPAAGTPGPLQPFASLLDGIVRLAIFYFAVFVYLAAVLYLGQKYMPVFATFLIDQGKAMAGNIFQRGVRPVGAATAYHWRKGLSESKWVQERATKAATAPTPELKGGRMLLAPVYAIRRGIGRALGPGLIEARKREIIAAEKKVMEIENPKLLKSKLESQRSHEDRIPYFTAAIEKGGPFKEEVEDSSLQAKEAAKKAYELGMVPQAEKIALGFKDKFTETDLKKIGFKSYQELSDKDKDEWDAKGYKTITQKLLGDVKGNEVKYLAKNFWTSAEAMEAVQRFWGGSQIAAAADTFGRRFVDDYMSVVERLTADQMAVFNPKAAMYLTGNTAQDFGFRAPGGVGREKMRKITRAKPPGYIPSEEDLKPLREKIRQVFSEETIIKQPPEKTSHRPPGPGKPTPHSAPSPFGKGQKREE